jgi:hypothetical protein
MSANATGRNMLTMVDMNLQRRDLLLWAALAATAVKPALAQDTSPRACRE